MPELTELQSLYEQVKASLISRGVLTVEDDIISFSGTEIQQPLPETPKSNPKTPKEQLPKLKLQPPKPILPTSVPISTKLTPDLIDIIVENANLISLAVFLGYTPQEAHDIFYNKSTYTIKELSPDIGAQVDQHNNVELNVKYFNYILQFNSSPERPRTYWDNLYVFTHEMLHILLSRCTDRTKLGMAIDEAITPLVEFEFYTNYNGAFNPFLIDESENGLERMMNKRAAASRVSYPTETFYFFDQLISLNALDHKLLIKSFRDYAHAPPNFKAKLASINNNFPFFPLQVQ